MELDGRFVLVTLKRQGNDLSALNESTNDEDLTHDLPGFLGLVSGVGLTFAYLTAGSPTGQLRRFWLKLQEQWITFRLRSLRKKQTRRPAGGSNDHASNRFNGRNP